MSREHHDPLFNPFLYRVRYSTTLERLSLDGQIETIATLSDNYWGFLFNQARLIDRFVVWQNAGATDFFVCDTVARTTQQYAMFED